MTGLVLVAPSADRYGIAIGIDGTPFGGPDRIPHPGETVFDAADRELTELGYLRTSAWVEHPDGTFTADINYSEG